MDFNQYSKDPKADFELQHDFRMATFEDAQKH